MRTFQNEQRLVGYNPNTNKDEEGTIRVIKRTIQVKDQMINGDFLELFNDQDVMLTNRELQLYNDKQWGELYKQKNNLLSAENIKEIREKRHLTQEGLAKFLKIGQKDIARYENGAIQTKSIDFMLRLVDDDHIFVEMTRVFNELH